MLTPNNEGTRQEEVEARDSIRSDRLRAESNSQTSHASHSQQWLNVESQNVHNHQGSNCNKGPARQTAEGQQHALKVASRCLPLFLQRQSKVINNGVCSTIVMPQPGRLLTGTSTYLGLVPFILPFSCRRIE